LYLQVAGCDGAVQIQLRESALRGKGAHSTYNDNPLVDVRKGAGQADVRLGGLWNRHVWKKDTIYFE